MIASQGVDEDLYITADDEAFVKWHAGQLTGAQVRGRAASKSTVSRRWSETSQPGTRESMFPTSGWSPVSRRDAQADNRDAALRPNPAIGQLLSKMAK